jgi:protein-disulfide isomerase
MNRLRILTAAAAALSLSLTAGVIVAAPAKPWSATVTTSPIGAHQIGNPKAKVQLVEYISYTCGHCADFARAASAPLKTGYVDKGAVRIEVRNAVRDPLDMTAALLARCDGPAKFLSHHTAILSGQAEWFAAVRKQSDATLDEWTKGSHTERLKKIAAGSGLSAMMQKRGMTAARIDACLSDENARQLVTAMTNFAWNVEKIDGTPAFLVNGKRADGAHDWPSLKTFIDRALSPS